MCTKIPFFTLLTSWNNNISHFLHPTNVFFLRKKKKKTKNLEDRLFFINFANKQNKPMDLSIIIPIYNVEKYIRTCLESVFQQGLDESCFEVIIVNDGSTDRSMEMIADIIHQHENTMVINQENQGLSVTRNNGIKAAKGEYILMLDSDDLLIENSLKPLLEKAIKTKVDLVVADFLSMTDEEIQHNKIHPQQQTEFDYKEKTGEELFIQDLNPYQCYVWRTLFKREFLIENNLYFIPGIYIQDVPFTHECYLKASKCLRTPWLFHLYRKGHESATFSFNKKKVKDFCTAIAKTWELTNLDGLSSEAQNKLRDDIFISFSLMVRIAVYALKDASDRIEVVDFLKQQVPDLWFRNGIVQKSISYMYRYLPHSFIKLRFLYAIIVEKKFRTFINHWFRRPSLQK